MTIGTIIGIVIIVGVIFMMIKKGGGGCCGGHDHGGGHTEDGGHDHGALGHQLPTDVDKTSDGKDPVCGMSVGKSEVFSSYEGKKYTFCSDSCRKTFEADPHKFTA